MEMLASVLDGHAHPGLVFAAMLPSLLARQRALSSRLSLGALRSYYRPARYAVGSVGLPTNTIVKFVPQQQAWIVERFGRFDRILEPGLAVLLPFVDQIRYVQSLKEQAVEIPSQSAITQGKR